MCRVNKTKYRPTHPKLYAISIVEQRGRSNALVVDERAVKASKVIKGKLAVLSSYLGMAARDYSRRSFNRHVHFRVAAQTRHVFTDLYASKLAGTGADDFNRGRLERRSGRSARRRRCALLLRRRRRRWRGRHGWPWLRLRRNDRSRWRCRSGDRGLSNRRRALYVASRL